MHTRTSKTKESAYMSQFNQFAVSVTVISTERGKRFLILDTDHRGITYETTCERLHAPQNTDGEKVIIMRGTTVFSRGKTVVPPQGCDTFFELTTSLTGRDVEYEFWPFFVASHFKVGDVIKIIPRKGSVPVGAFKSILTSMLLRGYSGPKDPLYEISIR